MHSLLNLLGVRFVRRFILILATASLAPICLLLFALLDDRSTASVDQIERLQPTLTTGQREQDGALVAHGIDFQSGETVTLYAVQSIYAAFADYVPLASVMANPNGSFDFKGVVAKSVWSRFPSTWLLIARGQSSGLMANRSLAAVAETAPLPPPAATLQPTVASPTPMPLPTPTPLPNPTAPGLWYGEFFPTRDLMPTVVYSRNEAVLDNNWTTAPHSALNLADFSARYTRREAFAETTSYEFALTVNGAARVFFDDAQIIDEWHNGRQRDAKVTVPVIAGEHKLRVEFYNADGPAMLRLTWMPRVFHGWQGRYFGNNSFSDSPALIRDDAKIDFNWDKGSPSGNIPADNFSAKWEKRECFKTGDYKLSVDADDWVRVFLDGKALDGLSTFGQGPGQREQTVRLSGCRMLEVQYIEYGEGAHVRFWWEPIVPTPTPGS